MDQIFHDPTPAKARIEIIPLIDVIFFLLATFVLFTLSLNRIKAIDVPLPVTPPILNPRVDETVFIQASDAGTLFWKNGRDALPEPITASELPARLAEYKRTALAPAVFVRGDNQATFGPAVTVLDEVRKAGIKRVSIETVPSPTGK